MDRIGCMYICSNFKVREELCRYPNGVLHIPVIIATKEIGGMFDGGIKIWSRAKLVPFHLNDFQYDI